MIQNDRAIHFNLQQWIPYLGICAALQPAGRSNVEKVVDAKGTRRSADFKKRGSGRRRRGINTTTQKKAMTVTGTGHLCNVSLMRHVKVLQGIRQEVCMCK